MNLCYEINLLEYQNLTDVAQKRKAIVQMTKFVSMLGNLLTLCITSLKQK